jgi:hypothetical protein
MYMSYHSIFCVEIKDWCDMANREVETLETMVTQSVNVDGCNYFVVDKDVSKGDRRSDGKVMAQFFAEEESATIINNVRESNRVKKRKDQEEAAFEEQALADSAVHIRNLEAISVNEAQEQSQVLSEEVSSNKKKRRSKIVDIMDDREGIEIAPITLRRPESGIRCAGRSNTTRLLWLHEFFVVQEGSRRKPVKYIYQALQFLLGGHLPAGAVQNMTDKMRRAIWVLGICHVPVDHIRHYSRRNKGYIFHTELNDADARTELFGTCPEVVRLEQCLKWHQMKHVSIEVPRVVHEADVQNRRIHVAGRANHFVCGVTAVEDLVTHVFTLAALPRCGFCTYPEERLGMELNSPSMMWEQLDDLFLKIRMCMSAGRQGTSSATVTIPMLCTVYDFWQVRLTFSHVRFNYFHTLCNLFNSRRLLGAPTGFGVPSGSPKREGAMPRLRISKLW